VWCECVGSDRGSREIARRKKLVAEDESRVLGLVTRILREGGYDIIPARNGHEAWAIFHRGDRRIDLVLADVVMARMTGTELAAHVVDRAPDLPIVLMSGFTPEDLACRGLVLSHGHLLTKPFEPSELLDLIGKLLPA
jgi:two-component system, cell cycle sensor histidine kinase and response regulator CckA